MISKKQTICEAIALAKSITCVYDGHKRLVSPHALGQRDGKTYVFVNIYGGYSARGISADPRQNWRCYDLEKLTVALMNLDPFATADNHSEQQTCTDTIEIEVNYEGLTF